MNLKNYTSNVAVEQTIARIEARLASIGASTITKHYGPDKRIAAILFVIELGQRRYTIRLPANADACYEAMWKQHCKRSVRIHPSAKERIKDQAQRTAWKLVEDWVGVQVSLIIMQQADWLQVFMAYVYDERAQQTVYDLAKDSNFKMLPYESAAPVNRQLQEVNQP